MPEFEKLELQKQEILNNFKNDYPMVYSQLQAINYSIAPENQIEISVGSEGTVRTNG